MGMKAHRVYRRAIRRNLKPYFANWMPGDPVNLGDYGYFRNGIFQYVGNIREDFEIAFEVYEDPTGSDLEFDANGSVDVNIDTGADAPELGKATLKLGFNGSWNVFFQALDTRTNRIGNKRAVGDAIENLYSQGKWERRFVLVTDVVNAGRTIAGVSSEGGAELEFSAKGEVPINILGDASVDLSIARTSKIGYKINTNGAQILLGLCKIKGRFGSPALRPKRATNPLKMNAILSGNAVPETSGSEDLFFGQYLGEDLKDFD